MEPRCRRLYHPSSTSSQSLGVLRSYASDGDANGVFYFLGTSGNTQTWQNPVTLNNLFMVSTSGILAGQSPITSITDRAASHFHTQDDAGSWVQFDLGPSRTLKLSTYSYRARDNSFTNTPTSWKMEGSNNGSIWTVIDAKSGISITVGSQWITTTVATSVYYRYFRITQTATSSSGSNIFTVGEVELYGELIDVGGVSVVSPIGLNYASDGDANGVFYFLGSNYGTGAWCNPQNISYPLIVTASGILSGQDPIDAITNRSLSHFHTTNAASSWVKFDLNAGRSLQVSAYSYRTRDNSTNDLPRAFKLEGSNDNTNWTQIDARSVTFTATNQWLTIPVSSATSYRYFRLTNTTTTTSGSNYFTIGEVEMYGSLNY